MTIVNLRSGLFSGMLDVSAGWYIRCLGTGIYASEENSKAKNGNGASLGIENELLEAADKLRGHLDAANYKSVVLWVIFFKYVSDRFEHVHARVGREYAL